MKYTEKTGRTVDEAVELALRELEVDREAVDVVVLDEGNKGLFGILGGKEARVKVSVLDGPALRAERFLNDVLQKMGVVGEIEITSDEDFLRVEIKGADAGILIGRRGETLDALQYLTSLVVNRGEEKYTRVTLDTENYRAKREETLIRLANKLADRAVKYRRSVTLEPMNPYERRIIHYSLQSNKLVTTFSTGDEPNRKIVISYKNEGPRRYENK